MSIKPHTILRSFSFLLFIFISSLRCYGQSDSLSLSTTLLSIDSLSGTSDLELALNIVGVSGFGGFQYSVYDNESLVLVLDGEIGLTELESSGQVVGGVVRFILPGFILGRQFKIAINPFLQDGSFLPSKELITNY